MPKRKYEESDEDTWRRKLKKYENKLRRKLRYQSVYSSDEVDGVIPEEHLEAHLATYEEAESTIGEIHEDAVPYVTHDDDATANNAHVHFNAISASLVNEEMAGSNSDNVNPDLLRALGDSKVDVEWGENTHENIARHLRQVLRNGLNKETKEELSKKYLVPKNVSLAKAPILNPEISAMLTNFCKNRDKRILNKQEQMGRALSALGKAMTALLKKNSNIPDIIRTLNDTGKLMADCHFNETETRRSLIIPLVDKSLIDLFKNRKRDNFLFGDKLGDLVKRSRGVKKTGELIQAAPVTSTSALNWNGPSSRAHQQRSGQSYRCRTDGQRTQFVHRYRGPSPLPQPLLHREMQQSALHSRRPMAQVPRPHHSYLR